MNFFYLYCIKCKNGVEECLNKVGEIADAQTSRSVSHLEHLLGKNERLQDTQMQKHGLLLIESCKSAS